MAEQTAQDVVTKTQPAGDTSSADGLGSTQKPLAIQGGEEAAVQKEAGFTDQTTENSADRQSISQKEQLGEEGTSGDVTQVTAKQQVDANRKELLEASEARFFGESIESPSANKESVSIDDAVSVQGSEDANHAGPDNATNSDVEAAGKTEGVEAKTISTIKKPAAFKSVSVTKNFLAKSGTPAPAATKTLGDKRRCTS